MPGTCCPEQAICSSHFCTLALALRTLAIAESSLAPGFRGSFQGSSKLFELAFDILSERIVFGHAGQPFLHGFCLFLLNALFFFDCLGRAGFSFDNRSI